MSFSLLFLVAYCRKAYVSVSIETIYLKRDYITLGFNFMGILKRKINIQAAGHAMPV
jgi:hypothetical protein